MITIEQVGFCYASRTEPALKNINLHIAEGAMFGLLGPNGAGKSTLLSILAGLNRLQSGSITVNGLSLRDKASAIKRLCALVPQEYAFYPQLTARENLLFFARVLGQTSAQAKIETERCIAQTQLERHADFRAATYSGGLKRRLNLAIGLLNHPRILFLDEPTVGVDAQSRNFLLDSIRTLNQHGMTVIYTSHYMEEVQQLCTDIAIIDHGEIRLSGNLDQLLNDQQQNLKLHLTSPASDQQLIALNQHFPALHVDPSRQHLQLKVEDDSVVAPLLQQLSHLNLSVETMQFGRSHRLEDVFLNITDRSLRD